MLTRTIKFLCSEALNPQLRELLIQSQTLEKEVAVANEKLVALRKQVDTQQKKLDERNKHIHNLRSQLTKDVIKGEELLKSGRIKSDQNRSESIISFAKNLTKIVNPLKEVKTLEKEEHEVDLREGFDLTSRLFFNTLEKYKITEFSPAPNAKFNKDEMIAEKQIKSENEKDKGSVAKVLEAGFTVDGKIIHKAKVQVYH